MEVYLGIAIIWTAITFFSLYRERGFSVAFITAVTCGFLFPLTIILGFAWRLYCLRILNRLRN